jgi:hypothetical protein
LLLLHILKICVDQADLKLVQELCVAAEVLADKEGILFIDSVIVDD